MNLARAVTAFAIALALLVNVPALAAGTDTQRFDVLISAGHEGRPASCARFPKRACNLGTAGELRWTPVVANEATRILREHGVSVAREPADFDGTYRVGAAVFIHLDGTEQPCTTGASVGYHSPQDVHAAQLWHAIYGNYFPFRFMPDNFTTNLSDYYGFRQVRADRGALVLELGEMTCPRERAWLVPRMQWQGAVIAYFVSQLLGIGQVPNPGPFRE